MDALEQHQRLLCGEDRSATWTAKDADHSHPCLDSVHAGPVKAEVIHINQYTHVQGLQCNCRAGKHNAGDEDVEEEKTI